MHAFFASRIGLWASMCSGQVTRLAGRIIDPLGCYRAIVRGALLLDFCLPFSTKNGWDHSHNQSRSAEMKAKGYSQPYICGLNCQVILKSRGRSMKGAPKSANLSRFIRAPAGLEVGVLPGSGAAAQCRRGGPEGRADFGGHPGRLGPRFGADELGTRSSFFVFVSLRKAKGTTNTWDTKQLFSLFS